MRNPDSVKNVDTPRNPPRAQVNPPWNSSTPSTASPRSPSRAGRWGSALEWFGGARRSSEVADALSMAAETTSGLRDLPGASVRFEASDPEFGEVEP